MAATTVSITIPEADVARVKLAAQHFTGLPATATAKELLAAVIRRITVIDEARVEAEAAANKAFAEPGVT